MDGISACICQDTTARSTADIGFIDLDVLVGSATDPVLIGSDHAGAELVQDLEGGFKTLEPDQRLNCVADMPGVWLPIK